MTDSKDLLKSSIKGIAEYVPGKSTEDIVAGYGLRPGDIIKLGSNENPLGPSARAVEAVRTMADSISVYPSVDAGELRRALAAYTGYPDDMVVMGAGMDGVVDTLMRLFVQPGNSAIIPTPTFSYFEIALRAAGGTPVFVKRQNDYSVPVQAIISSLEDSTRMIYLCSPNNPSGNTISEEGVRAIVESTNAIVFLDEAYVEFATKSLVCLVSEYDNLVVGRTMSKAMGLAGLRIGYAVVPNWIFREYMKATTPFAISRIAVAAGLAALDDVDYRRKTIDNVHEGRKFLTEHLSGHCRVYPSEGNFILIDVSPKKSKDVVEVLVKIGIIVRDCTSFRDAGDGLIRITVGTPDQNKRVAGALQDALTS
ncbi:MAG: histidinol-phosphate transaminase [ANME-2 cluster archaeon]|nr:histidinol-phosphate transaminase [ANME-2 cluster archaeon]